MGAIPKRQPLAKQVAKPTPKVVQYTFTVDLDGPVAMADPESSFIVDPTSDSGIHSYSTGKSLSGSGSARDRDKENSLEPKLIQALVHPVNNRM